MYEGTDEYWQEEESNLVFKRSMREKAWTEDIGYDATFYEARTEGMAARYLDEAFRYSEEGSFEPENQRIDVPGVEWAGMYEADFQGHHEQHLWLKQGNRLEQIIYFGDKDVLDYIDLFVEDINEE